MKKMRDFQTLAAVHTHTQSPLKNISKLNILTNVRNIKGVLASFSENLKEKSFYTNQVLKFRF